MISSNWKQMLETFITTKNLKMVNIALSSLENSIFKIFPTMMEALIMQYSCRKSSLILTLYDFHV